MGIDSFTRPIRDFTGTKDLLRPLEIFCGLQTHLLCAGSREGHLLGLLFQQSIPTRAARLCKSPTEFSAH